MDELCLFWLFFFFRPENINVATRLVPATAVLSIICSELKINFQHDIRKLLLNDLENFSLPASKYFFSSFWFVFGGLRCMYSCVN